MNTIHIFHHNDADGWLSAAIIYNAYIDKQNQNPEKSYQFEFYEVDYSMDLSQDLIKIPTGSTIYFVDYSFTEETFLRLVDLIKIKDFKVTWIDHHKTSAEIYITMPPIYFSYFDNVIIDEKNEHAACYHTHKYFHRNEDKNPLIVDMVDSWDTFSFQKYDKDDHMYFNPIYFNYGCVANMNKKPSSPEWRIMLKEYEQFGTENAVLDVIAMGRTVFTMKCNESMDFIHKFGNSGYLNGHKTVYVNKKMSSLEFGDYVDKYDIVCPFYYNAKTNSFIFSLYTNRDDVDVSEIAKKLGGGGHRRAAGFQVANTSIISFIMGERKNK